MTYRAPIRDLLIALDAAGHQELAALAFPELDAATMSQVLASAATFAEKALAPLNQIGDREGARLEDGMVRAPSGFGAAYSEFAAQGWNSLSAPEAYGGQGLSKALELAVFEMYQAANMAFSLCPMLTQGAIEALARHGAPHHKALVLPKLVSGEWTGTMNLTEPQAGTDLAALTTRALPQSDGSYRLHGQKIFITWGDHDLTENIAHLVLARTPDAPTGVRGISLFLATKRRLNADGSPGEANDLRAASLEHKLGIHGSPTCVMLFEGARAELVGELGDGLPQMFVMMNAARLNVGMQGVAIAERAFQQALAFTRERRQGKSAWSAEYPAELFHHPDVRRSLMLMKAKIEAARGVCLLTAVCADLAEHVRDPDTRLEAAARHELLTPIAKAWSTDLGVEIASQALQLHGGMGFIEETGAAQHYRDARIAPIYEGANGVQAADLVGRKAALGGGSVLRNLCFEIERAAANHAEDPALGDVARRLSSASASLLTASEWIIENKGAAALASSTPFLKLAGEVIGGWMLLRQAIAVAGDEASGLAKTGLARVYATQVLSGAAGQADAVCQPPDDLQAAEALALAS